MPSLKQTLEQFQKQIRTGLRGGDLSIDAAKPVSKQEFIDRIKVISGHNRIFLWINVFMLLVVFLGSVYLVYHFINDLNKLTIIFSITGISIAGMIYYMTYLWRQIVGIDLAIAMAERLDDSALPALINGLLASYKKDKES
jgi:hypothetical protein